MENNIQQIKESIKIINEEMGEIRDSINDLKVAMIRGDAKLKEEIICELNRQIESSKQDRALIHQELGIIKERIKYGNNGRQWFEKTLIFIIGVLLTIVGLLIKLP